MLLLPEWFPRLRETVSLFNINYDGTKHNVNFNLIWNVMPQTEAAQIAKKT